MVCLDFFPWGGGFFDTFDQPFVSHRGEFDPKISKYVKSPPLARTPPLASPPRGLHWQVHKVQKPPSQLRFSLPSIIITITSNEPWNTETHKTDRNPPITNHKLWPFELVKVKFCFLRGPLRWWLRKTQSSVGFWTSEFACLWKAQ